MRAYWMTTAAIVLAGCSGGPSGEPPSLTYGYVEAQQIEPPVETTPQPPMPIAGVAANPDAVPAPKTYKSGYAKIAAEVRKSKKDAKDCTFEGAIMTCPYVNGRIQRVILDGPTDEFSQSGSDANVTTFYLEPGESNPEVIMSNLGAFVPEITAGGEDSTSWRAKRDRANGRTTGARLIITVQAQKNGETSTMHVATGNRVYLYELTVPDCPLNEDGTPRRCNHPYNPVVQHTYESDQPKAPKVSANAHRSMPAVSDTRYRYEGSAGFLPNEWSAYNDGVNTYILPPARLASRPVPFLPQGSAPYFWVDPQSKHYVIRGLPAEVAFIRGEEKMTVRRDR